MTETYKWKSRTINIISFIATILSYVTVDQLLPLLPTELKVFAPTIVAIIGYIATQLSEEKRIDVAEQLKTEELTTQIGV
jgi:hypothetical protein